MIYGIGTDIVSIERVRSTIERFGERFARRILTEAEMLEYRNSPHPERLLAKRFAAKEAIVKALGLGIREGLAWNLIGVTHDRYGKPGIAYEGATLKQVQEMGIAESLITLSDEQDYAVAFVVLIRD